MAVENIRGAIEAILFANGASVEFLPFFYIRHVQLGYILHGPQCINQSQNDKLSSH